MPLQCQQEKERRCGRVLIDQVSKDQKIETDAGIIHNYNA